MSVPKIKELKNDPFLQEEWRICPRCQGGRGETVQIEREMSGEINKVFVVRTCSLCNGDRVIPKLPVQQ